MSATTTTTSSTASAYAEGAIPAILVRGGGPTDSVAAVAAHEARTQDFTPATRPDGLRADREYPRQFDVENPGEQHAYRRQSLARSLTCLASRLRRGLAAAARYPALPPLARQRRRHQVRPCPRAPPPLA